MSNISNFYKNFSLINDIFYKTSSKESIIFLKKILNNDLKTLDCGCGDGQVSLEILKDNENLHGFDISIDMINSLKSKVDNKYYSNFKVMDALEISQNNIGIYDQAYCVRTSFGNFTNKEHNIIYLENVYNCLSKNSVFILDYLNFDFIIKNFKSEIVLNQGDYTLEKKSKVIYNKEYMSQKWTLKKNSEIIDVFSLGTYIFKNRDFKKILKDIGFEIDAVYGDYDFSDFKISSSQRAIYKLRKV